MTEPREPTRGAAEPFLVVEAAEAGLRADQFLQRRLPGLGRREAARLFAGGALALERPGRPREPARKGLALAVGDRLHLAPEVGALWGRAPGRDADAPPVPALLPGVTIVHEDAHVLVLSKPAGVPTHPLRSGESGTLANHLAALAPLPTDLGGQAREAGLVHRLDTLTSGLVVAARTPEAYAHLRRQLAEHRVDKAYLALVTGSPLPSLHVDEPIESRRGRRRVTLGRGQPAETFITLRRLFADLALVEARTRFGRRHQVRAHLAHAGHPLLGDPLYARTGARSATAPPGASPVVDGPWPLLFACFLGFEHPADCRRIELALPLPDHVEAALAQLPVSPCTP